MVAAIVGVGSAANAAPVAQAAQGQQAAVAAACNGDTIWAFNKQGCKKAGSTVVSCWIIDHAEYFHVAPSGSIWHIWDGASSWKAMPNSGNADDMWDCTFRASDGLGNGVRVRVGSALWYSYQNASPANVWYGWYQW